MPRTPHDPCRLPLREVIINTIVSGLIRERIMPPGSIIDVGAHTGEWSCFYAGLDPGRSVHAIEPLAANADHIRRTYSARFPNIAVTHAGLGREETMRTAAPAGDRAGAMVMDMSRLQEVPQGAVEGVAGSSFPVHAVDRLFAREQVGFAHIDVEGSELEVLQGAQGVIRRDQPIFSIEVHMHKDQAFTGRLLDFVNGLGYHAYLVDEVCGLRVDCRNLLCLPASRMAVLKHSHTLLLAQASRRLIPIGATSFRSLAFPCCAPGGGCKCTRKSVTLWLNRNPVSLVNQTNFAYHVDWLTQLQPGQARWVGAGGHTSIAARL